MASDEASTDLSTPNQMPSGSLAPSGGVQPDPSGDVLSVLVGIEMGTDGGVGWAAVVGAPDVGTVVSWAEPVLDDELQAAVTSARASARVSASAVAGAAARRVPREAGTGRIGGPARPHAGPIACSVGATRRGDHPPFGYWASKCAVSGHKDAQFAWRGDDRAHLSGTCLIRYHRDMADKITQNADGSLNVTDNPIIPFIEGDGTGVDIWPAAKLVLDAAAVEVRPHHRVERGAGRREGLQPDR